MKLDQVIAGIDAAVKGGADLSGIDIDRVVSDSRQAGVRTLFVAVPGARVDGHDFVGAAVAAGAPAVVVEHEVAGAVGALRLHVANARRAAALCAANLAGRPAESLRMVGITGTNGKTTVSWLLESILLAAGRSPGLVGTVEHRFAGQVREAMHTTPAPETLQALLREMVDAGIDDVVLEVSSHALVQERVAGCRFAVAAFTNLSREHLDYHADLDDYFAAKSRLFEELLTPDATAVVNVDDEWGAKLHERLKELGVSTLTVTTTGSDAGLRVTDVELSLEGIEATLVLPDATMEVRSPLVGAHNLENICVAAGIAHALALPADAIVRGIAGSHGAPGRLEPVDDPAGRHVFVDYAHTDDAIGHALAALRALLSAEARLVIVFGCGGERDRGKRPLMAGAASAADVVVVTSDNPRTEDPRAIIDEILPGLTTKAQLIEPDRALAIEAAVGIARPGDVVLIAGKGHERFQLVNGERRPFDDRLVASQALQRVAAGTRPMPGG